VFNVTRVTIRNFVPSVCHLSMHAVTLLSLMHGVDVVRHVVRHVFVAFHVSLHSTSL
jgi:hypothetical protein